MSGPPSPRLLLDRMLIRLGKYLRIIGCDAAWDSGLGAADLLARAQSEGRRILTSNKRLAEAAPDGLSVLLVEAIDPVFQFHRVVAELGLDPQVRLFSRCIRCNVELVEIHDRADLAGRVDVRVLARQQLFFTCPACHTVFWYGSHVQNTCRKLGLVPPPDRL